MDPVLWLILPGLFIWFAVMMAPWRPWSTKENLDATATIAVQLQDLTVIIPARNEAEFIAATLRAVAEQGSGHKILLVDDQSCDGTVEAASRLRLDNLTVLSGEPLPDDWTGKLWALEQGRREVTTEFVLLLDADIRLEPGIVAALLAKMADDRLDLLSLMAMLRMNNFWERLLMPAFIYFFKLLYPFRLANSESKLIAAAAGGCILTKTQVLERIGGFAALKDALIDDCTLARRVKDTGFRTWLGLTHSARSQRKYLLRDVWDMVARTAYAQLHQSISLLLLCTALMIAAFVAPFAGFAQLSASGITLASMTLGFMISSYLPILKYYELHPAWALLLPFVGCMFLAMTWSSALHAWTGTGASWKERNYSNQAS